MATDQFDSDKARLSPEQIAELTSLQKKSRPKPTKRPRISDIEFVMFPYEQFLAAAGRARNIQLAVLIELAHLRFKTHKSTVELGNKALAAVGIQRWAKLDALTMLEDAGLIRIEHRHKKSPLVTLLWD